MKDAKLVKDCKDQQIQQIRVLDSVGSISGLEMNSVLTIHKLSIFINDPEIFLFVLSFSIFLFLSFSLIRPTLFLSFSLTVPSLFSSLLFSSLLSSHSLTHSLT